MKSIILAMSLISLFSLTGQASDDSTVYCRGDAMERYSGSENSQVKKVKIRLKRNENGVIDTYYKISLVNVPAAQTDIRERSGYSTMLKDNNGYMDIKMYVNYNSTIIKGVLFTLFNPKSGKPIAQTDGQGENISHLDFYDETIDQWIGISCKMGLDQVLYTEVP